LNGAQSYAACWRSGWSACGSGIGFNLLTTMEKFAYTIGPTGAFMQPRLTGGLHDDT
jgi:hypothetical protein